MTCNDGERGYSPPSLRYMFYIYYPVHLIVIGGIKLVMETISFVSYVDICYLLSINGGGSL